MILETKHAPGGTGPDSDYPWWHNNSKKAGATAARREWESSVMISSCQISFPRVHMQEQGNLSPLAKQRGASLHSIKEVASQFLVHVAALLFVSASEYNCFVQI